MLSNVEALDEYQHLSCNISSYPIAIYALSSTVTSTGILVCGGRISSVFHKDCYEYRASGRSWVRMPSMTTERAGFYMIYLKGKVYAVGGERGSGATNSMDIFDSKSGMWTKQLIPFNVAGHCITQLSANQFILMEGYYKGVS